MDPFMYLTVPLPIKQTVEFTAYFVPKDPEKDVVKLNLLISANASFAQIKDNIGALVDADPSHLSKAEIELMIDDWGRPVQRSVLQLVV